MQSSKRARALKQRLRTNGAIVHNGWGIPAAMLMFATLVLIIVPIARAATSEDPSSTTGAPIVQEDLAQTAKASPKIAARITRANAVNGAPIRVVASVRGIPQGKIKVKLGVRRAGKRSWRVVKTVQTRSRSAIKLSWRGQRAGRFMARVSVTASGKTAVDRVGRVFVFRRSFASYYGPGLYGGGLACGGRLSPSTIGVAHKTLPCGTRVAFRVGGRVVTARVIDRGPYVGGRDWDLTAGLKRKLGFGSTGVVYSTE